MDVHWMQNFLFLPQCDAPAQTPASSLPLKTNRPTSLDDVEGEDDARCECLCPFCYEELDIISLCSHLERDHCIESKSAECPVCAAKVGKDMLGHISLQHGQFFKMQRRRRFRKTTVPSSSTLSLIGKELLEVALQGGNTHRSSTNASHGGTDPLLSSLVYNLPVPEASKTTAASEEVSETRSSTADNCNLSSCISSLTGEECKRKVQAVALQVKFVQQLVLSIIFSDD